jgi:hypothetical protein
MFDDEREIRGDAAVVWPSAYAPLLAKDVKPFSKEAQGTRGAQEQLPSSGERELHERASEGARETEKERAPTAPKARESEGAREHKKTRRVDLRAHLPVRGTDVSIRGLRRAVPPDAQTSRPPVPLPVAQAAVQRVMPATSNAAPARAQLPRCSALRGGTQLVRVGDDAWLGIGHEMRYVKGRKLYWHTWYLTNSRGKLIAVSPPMKLAPNGIEFAAGMGIEGDRVVVSFGVDDMESKLGETSLAAVLELIGGRDPR